MEFYNKHYITVDGRGRIMDGFSDAFRKPSETDICINEEGGYQFRLFPDGWENPVLIDENRIALYKYDGGDVIKRTLEEIAEDIASLVIPEPAPSTEERVTELEVATAALEDAVCELDAANEERIAAIEDALCEMDMG